MSGTGARHTDPMRRLHRRAAIVSALLVLGYGVVAASFTLPAGPVRDAAAPVRSLTQPFFSQNWNMFAPNVPRSDRRLLVQGAWWDGEQLVEGEWIDASSAELLAARTPPSRLAKISLNAWGRMDAVLRPLNERQRALFEQDFVVPSAEQRDLAMGRGPLEEQLRSASKDSAAGIGAAGSKDRELTAPPAGETEFRTAMNTDDALASYAAAVATAVEGRPVARVRVSLWERPTTVRENASLTAEERDAVSAERILGWRVVADGATAPPSNAGGGTRAGAADPNTERGAPLGGTAPSDAALHAFERVFPPLPSTGESADGTAPADGEPQK